MAGNLQNVTGVSKGLMMFGTEGAGGLASSTNQLVNQLAFCNLYYPRELLMYFSYICWFTHKTFNAKNVTVHHPEL